MKAHLQAVRAIVASLGYDVHIGDVPSSAAYPYVLLWGSGGRMTSPTLCGAQDDLNDLFGVTMTATNASAALDMPPMIRTALLGSQLVVPGRFVQPLSLYDSQNVQVDAQVTLPRSNRHPAYVVDLYRVISEPA